MLLWACSSSPDLIRVYNIRKAKFHPFSNIIVAVVIEVESRARVFGHWVKVLIVFHTNTFILIYLEIWTFKCPKTEKYVCAPKQIFPTFFILI